MKNRITIFLLAIAVVLTFTFTLADYVNEVGQTKAYWFHRTDRDLIIELRLKINRLICSLVETNQENRYLRRLVYTTKPDHWGTWLALLDECKRLGKIIEEQREEIKILEHKLNIRLWQIPAPYWKA